MKIRNSIVIQSLFGRPRTRNGALSSMKKDRFCRIHFADYFSSISILLVIRRRIIQNPVMSDVTIPIGSRDIETPKVSKRSHFGLRLDLPTNRRECRQKGTPDCFPKCKTLQALIRNSGISNANLCSELPSMSNESSAIELLLELTTLDRWEQLFGRTPGLESSTSQSRLARRLRRREILEALAQESLANVVARLPSKAFQVYGRA
jgi:hypothetical protein